MAIRIREDLPVLGNVNIDRRGRQSSLGQFFTKGDVSRVLASFMDRLKDGIMVDLGSGDGRLSQSVSTVGRLSRIVTVDVDANVTPIISSSPHFHVHGDALDFELPSRLCLDHGLFDLAICNPPYVKQVWRHEFGRIIEEAGLSSVCPAFPEARGEILFLAQLLRLIKSGGQVGVIVPDGPITGEGHQRFRKHLLSHHRVERVISLPSGMFVGTEARAHILILRKDAKPNPLVALMQLDDEGRLSPPLQVSCEAAEFRMDYLFHVASLQAGRIKKNRTLRQVGAEIVRGSISSSELALHHPTFHTSDFPSGDERVGFSLAGNCPSRSRMPEAGPRDVLVARIGRKLEEKVCRVSTGYAHISDCVFRIRVPPQFSMPLYDALSSSRGQHYLRSVSRGVGARYLTVQALLDFPI